MNKNNLINKTVDVLKKKNARKKVTAQKTILHISDDFGNKSDFSVRKSNTGLLFTAKDVSQITDALLEVIENSLKEGEEVAIHGFGKFDVKHRAARSTKDMHTGETINIDERYVTKFNCGNSLKMAAKIYQMSLEDETKVV